MDVYVTDGETVDLLSTRSQRRHDLFEVMNLQQRHLWGLKKDDNRQHSVAMCHRFPISSEDDGVLIKRRETGSAFYTRVHRCGSPWACAICADRIMTVRQEEIRALEASENERWFVTLTARHGITDPLDKTLGGIREAFTRLGEVRSFQRYRKSCEGYVRSTEITRTRKNGWHPHFHILFIGPKPDFMATWIACLKSVGLEGAGASYDCRESWDLATYIAKMQTIDTVEGALEEAAPRRRTWDISQEAAARPNTKKSSRSIWQIRSGDLIREHFLATKGVSRIRWSKGLKADYGVQDLSDEQASSPDSEEASLVMVVDPNAFVMLANMGLRAQLLEAVEKGGKEAGQAFIAGLPKASRSVR